MDTGGPDTAARTASKLTLSESRAATTGGYGELPRGCVQWVVGSVFKGGLDGEGVDVGVVRLQL